MALLSVAGLSYAIGERNLLDSAGFVLEKGERVCLLGRNGEGKTTLLKILAGRLQAEDGTIQWQAGARCALVAQQTVFAVENGENGPTTATVFDAVAQGLGGLAAQVSDYHAQTLRVAQSADPAGLERLNRLQQQLEAQDGWRLEQRVEQVISRLKLPADAPLASLSGGWQRRVALARALVQEPDLLMLDEPTNHLDIEAIEWLEQGLLAYPGAVLFVTHDRSFLQKLATRILELDRGQLTAWPGDYANYLRRKEEREHAENRHNERFDRRLAQEEVWIRQGIEARRTRNQGRVRALQALREQRRGRIVAQGKARMVLGAGERSGALVIEAEGLSKHYDGKAVVDDFSCRIQRGDRIGLLGPNGIGKTTLLKLLLGELKADGGKLRHGTQLEIAYFDQYREQLEESLSVQQNVSSGDTVTVDGRQVHVISYLKNFLFTAQQARGPISALSGGERNRLLLARLFAKPFNLLVMDEPTNDLDLETLEVLEDLLSAYRGTLLLVSHDRSFLDNVVTATLAFEGEGKIQAYAGGYQDWLRQRPTPSQAKPEPKEKPQRTNLAQAQARRLTYKEQRELQQLPTAIEELEAELGDLQALVAEPDFYRREPFNIKETMAKLQRLQDDLQAAYRRWQELDGL